VRTGLRRFTPDSRIGGRRGGLPSECCRAKRSGIVVIPPNQSPICAPIDGAKALLASGGMRQSRQNRLSRPFSCHIRNTFEKSAQVPLCRAISSLHRWSARIWSSLRNAGNAVRVALPGRPGVGLSGTVQPLRGFGKLPDCSMNRVAEARELPEERTAPSGPIWRSGHENENVSSRLRRRPGS